MSDIKIDLPKSKLYVFRIVGSRKFTYGIFGNIMLYYKNLELSRIKGSFFFTDAHFVFFSLEILRT